MSDKNLSNDAASILIKRNGETVTTADTVSECSSFSSYTASEEGTYKIEAELEGKAQKTEKNIGFTIDRTAPSVSDITLSGTQKEGYDWFCSAVTAGAEAGEDLSGIDRADVYLNGKNKGSAAISENKLSFTLTEEMLNAEDAGLGVFTVRFDIYDRAGNKTARSAQFCASVSAPKVTLSGIADGAFTNEKPSVKAGSTHPEKTSRVEMAIKKNGEAFAAQSGATAVIFAPPQDGFYEITAALTDKAGNVSAQQSLSFTYDTAAPVLSGSSITGPLRSGCSWYYDSVTIEAGFSDELSGLASCSIAVNGKTVAEDKSASGAMSKSLSSLLSREWFAQNESKDGKYEVTFTAADRAGNKMTEKKEFFADVVTPQVAISGIDEGAYTNEKVEIEAVVTDNYPERNTIVFTVTRNGRLFKEYTENGGKASFDGFTKDGVYKVSVRSTDMAGNVSETMTLSFTRDTVAPVISISGAKAGTYTRGAKTLQAHIKELNYHNMAVGGDITRTLDGKKTAIGWGKIKPEGENYTYTKKVNGTGTYTVTLTAEDKAGNRAAPKSLIFTIDNDKPVVKITNTRDLNGYSDVVAPKVSWQDSYFASKNITLTRSTGESTEGLSSREGKDAKGGTRTYSDFVKQKQYDDIYTLTCSCVDKAGNRASVTRTFTVCRFGSRYRVAKHSRPVNGTFRQEMTDAVYLIETNPAGITKTEGMVTLDGARIDADVKTSMATTAAGWASCTYAFPASAFAEEGIYELDARSSDTAGNSSSFKDTGGNFRFTIDKTPPVITVKGVRENGRYTLDEAVATVSVTDSIGVEEYDIDFADSSLYSSAGSMPPAEKKVLLKPGMNKSLLVKATDRAGNEAVERMDGITVSDNALVRYWANKPLVGGTAAGLAIAVALAVLAMRRRKKIT